MGCGSSKNGDTEALALCRNRVTFVNDAVNLRFALAGAHLTYLHSLKSFGVSLHRFFNSSGDLNAVVNIPGEKKIQEEEEEYPGHHLKPLSTSSSNGSGHHLHHLSGSDSDSDNVQMGFMKSNPTPSVSYQQTPFGGTESIQFEMMGSYASPYFIPNQNPDSQFYGNPYDYGGSGYMGYGGFQFQTTSNYPPPPPPPPPESSSSWDLFYPFEMVESMYAAYTPSRVSKGSRDSKEVREEEGIPDLEEDDNNHQEGAVEVVDEEQKLVDESENDGDRKGDSVEDVKEEIRAATEIEEIVPAESNPGENEVHVVEEKVVVEEEGNVGGFRNVSDVVSKIQAQFERASDSGGELAKMLEVGKLPYHLKGSSAYQVSSKMLSTIALSLSSNSDSAAEDKEDTGLSSGNLSATLQKLYLWEKKLYEEVKVEEKNRVAHGKKVKKMQRLVDKAAEAHKIDSTRRAIRDLSTKLRVSIQIIDRISKEISKLRDEELWLQLNELIQGFSRMWKAMLECHHIQFQALQGATGLDTITSSKNSNEAHLESLLSLEQDLINWTSGFSNWIDTQKRYVNSLNSWLLKCLVYEPEETPDGIAPFSPGRAGAPPVFVICNQWAQALETLSEKEVLESMRVFAALILQFWERDKAEMQQRMADAVAVLADKDVENKLKNLQKEDIKIHKQIQALDKKMVLDSGESNINLSLTGNVVFQSDTKTSLHSGLQQIFEAMDKYTSESLKVYDELISRAGEIGKEGSAV